MATNEGKRIRAAREGIEPTKLYGIEDAVKLIKERAKAKFDETVEIAMNLGVDPRHADQMVRGVVSLPNGSGRSVRVIDASEVAGGGLNHDLFLTNTEVRQAIRSFIDGARPPAVASGGTSADAIQ